MRAASVRAFSSMFTASVCESIPVKNIPILFHENPSGKSVCKNHYSTEFLDSPYNSEPGERSVYFLDPYCLLSDVLFDLLTGRPFYVPYLYFNQGPCDDSW